LGPARDSEVMAARLQAALAEEPAELVVGPVARQISVSFSTQHAQARDRLLAALTSERYAALLERLDEVVDGPPVKAVTKAALRKRARKALHRVTARLDLAERLADAPGAGARVTPPLPGVTPDRDTALHDARKAAKRARYAAEALRPLGGKDARRLVKRFKHLQEMLGVHQDSIITRQVLRDQGMRAYLDGQNSFTYGLLHAKQELAGKASLAELGAARKAIGTKATSWLR
jgi:CHAD domain-containing protein